MYIYYSILIHWGRVTHICGSKLTTTGSDNGLSPSRYLNQCWNIVNWTLKNKLQWNLNRKFIYFHEENAFTIVVWKMAAILSRPQCVNLLMYDETRVMEIQICVMKLHNWTIVFSNDDLMYGDAWSIMEIQISFMNFHNCAMDFYKLFMIIEHL